MWQRDKGGNRMSIIWIYLLNEMKYYSLESSEVFWGIFKLI
jgi:hypothetical protein